MLHKLGAQMVQFSAKYQRFVFGGTHSIVKVSNETACGCLNRQTTTTTECVCAQSINNISG